MFKNWIRWEFTVINCFQIFQAKNLCRIIDVQKYTYHQEKMSNWLKLYNAQLGWGPRCNDWKISDFHTFSKPKRSSIIRTFSYTSPTNLSLAATKTYKLTCVTISNAMANEGFSEHRLHYKGQRIDGKCWRSRIFPSVSQKKHRKSIRQKS